MFFSSLERFFAAAAEQDDGLGWLRPKREGLLRAEDRRVGDLGNDGALVDRTLWALRTA